MRVTKNVWVARYGAKKQKMFLAAYFVCLSLLCIGQYDNGVKSYMPSTPTAASFGKIAEQSTESFSGNTTISIPLTSISENNLTHTLSISYNTSGIKGSETASSVGLGWTLNAGGAISRSMRGSPDERLFENQLTGYYTDMGVNPAWFSNSFQLEQLEAGTRDPESDIYYFNFDGYTGSFVFGPNQTIVMKEKSDLLITPINTGYNFNKLLWKITTPDGNKYFFGDTHTSDGVSDDAVSYSNQYSQPKDMVGAPGRTNPLVDSWYLVRVESFDGTSSIDFVYEKYEAYSFRDIGSSVNYYVDADGNDILGNIPLQQANVVLCTESLTPRLTKIVTEKRSIIFDYETTARIDLDNVATPGYHPRYVVGIPAANITFAARLKSIQVVNASNTIMHKYDLIQSYFWSNASGFDGTLGLTQQNDQNGLFYTDMRRLRLDSLKLTESNKSVAKHGFEYFDSQIQRRLTYALDDHGYPNGATGNITLIPKLVIDTLSTTAPMIDLSSFTSLADRSPNITATKKAMLKKITYPYGGNRSFDFENHDYYTNKVIETGANIIDIRNPNCSSPSPPANCNTCCQGGTVTSGQVILSNAVNKRYKLSLTGIKTPNDNNAAPITLYLYVKPGASGNWQPFDYIVLDPSNGYNAMRNYDKSSFPTPPDNTFQWQMVADPSRFLFMQLILTEYTRSDQPTNKPIGGLRLKSITDDPVTGPQVVKTYKYTTAENSSSSSGYPVTFPTYLETLPADAQYTLMADGIGGYVCVPVKYRFTSGNTFPMASVQGSHIGYSRITEQTSTGIGYTERMFKTDANHRAKYVRAFPSLPEYLINDQAGKIDIARNYDNTGTVIQSTGNLYTTYDYPNTDLSYTVRSYTVCNSVNYVVSQYIIPSRFVYVNTATLVKDNVTVQTLYEHGALPDNTGITASQYVNSDAKTHRTENFYTNTYPYNVNVKNELLSQNRIGSPWQSIKKVNGTIIDGTETKYAYTDPITGAVSSPSAYVAGARVYPAIENRREVTWSAGSVVDNGWQSQKEIVKYDLNTGKPKEIKITNWIPNHLMTWSTTGKLLTYQYQSHNQTFSYDAQNDELATKVYIDGTSDSYTYDPILRLQTITNNPKNVVTRFTYKYANSSGGSNFIKTRQTYPIVTGSSIDSLVDLIYVDGLGRELQNIKKYGSSLLTADVVEAFEYDNAGRPIKKYVPIEADNNHGNLYSGSFNGGFTASTYQANPLNRTSSVTPPSWYATTSTYGTNTAAMANPEGLVYPANGLMMTAQTDPDGNITETYTDKAARQVLVRRKKGALSSDTWTIYDDKNRPVKVYPPGTGTTTPNLIFEYRYDSDDNLVYKKVPDAASEEMRYNARNLQTAMRNGVLSAAGKWLVTHYDEYGRPTKRGYYTGADPGTADNPTISTLLEEYFYDGFNGSTTNTSAIYKGKLKKSRIKTLEDNGANNGWTEIENFYDSYGRVLTQTLTNHLGGTESKMFTYDFADNILSEIHNIAGPATINHVSKHTYDHRGRTIFDKINVDNLGEITTAESKYDHKSQLIEKNIGRFATTGTHQYLQSLDYTYNVQGWMTAINQLFTGVLPYDPEPCGPVNTKEQSVTVTDTDTQDLFAQDLGYNSTIVGSGVTSSLNGNITTLKWWHRDRYNQTYSYKYDYLNRVTDAVHGQIAAGTYTKLNRYDEKWQYDVRGNITNLNRKGMTYRPDLGIDCYTNSTIDSLSYVYQTGTNKLVQVIDKAPCPDTLTLPATIDRDAVYAAGQVIRVADTDVWCGVNLKLTAGNKVMILDTLKLPALCGTPAYVHAYQGPCPDDKVTEGFSQQSLAGQYTYDNSGNMTYDPNKKLTFYYNYLNLPYKIAGAENDEMQMLYGADGSLLQRRYIKNGSEVSKTDYLRGKEMKNGVMESVYHTDGRVVKSGGTWQYEYWLKDHLGNTREIFTDVNGDGVINGAERKGQMDYYNFGMEWNGMWSRQESTMPENKYRYNGKEKWEEMDLGLYHYGARMMDPVLGRFTSVDPLAHKMPFVSPYNNCLNNPINMIDPDGRIPYPITIRAFAPFSTFGGGFHGDNRGYSTGNVSARVHQKINFDTDKTTITTNAWSSPSWHYLKPDYKKTATPSVSFDGAFTIKQNGDAKTFNFGTHVSGANPLTPGAPNIDVFSNFAITENKKAGTLDISGKLTGDNFPSTEAFITDPAGNNAFIGVGFYEGSPFSSLWGENKDNPITSFSFSISTDKDGNFTGVKVGDKSFTLPEWNKMFEQANPHKNEEQK